MKKRIGIVCISVFVCMAMICALAVSMSSDTSAETAFYADLERRIEDHLAVHGETYMNQGEEFYKIWEFPLLREAKCAISDEMLGGVRLYEGHFFVDWRTNGFDETELREICLEIAHISRYYNELAEKYNDSSRDPADYARITALRAILRELEQRKNNAFPQYS